MGIWELKLRLLEVMVAVEVSVGEAPLEEVLHVLVVRVLSQANK